MNEFLLMHLWGSYLVDNDYNTYDEIMDMTYNEIEERYFEVINE